MTGQAGASGPEADLARPERLISSSCALGFSSPGLCLQGLQLRSSCVCQLFGGRELARLTQGGLDIAGGGPVASLALSCKGSVVNAKLGLGDSFTDTMPADLEETAARPHRCCHRVTS